MNDVTNANELPPKMGAIALRPRTAGGGRVVDLNTLEDVARLSTMILASGLAPKDFNSPERIAIALLHGMEVGLSPMTSMQKIAVINGRPTIWGDAALAVVEASGQLVSIREGIEGTGEQRFGFCEVTRKGRDKSISTFSIKDARTAGLWEKRGAQGQPTPWVTHPERMLKMRARGFALRDQFSDVLGGMYLAEELQGTEEPRDITPAPPSPPPAPRSDETVVEVVEVPVVVVPLEEAVLSPPTPPSPPSPPPVPAEADAALGDSLPPEPGNDDKFDELLEMLDSYGDSTQHLHDWRQIVDRELHLLNEEQRTLLLGYWTRRLEKL